MSMIMLILMCEKMASLMRNGFQSDDAGYDLGSETDDDEEAF